MEIQSKKKSFSATTKKALLQRTIMTIMNIKTHTCDRNIEISDRIGMSSVELEVGVEVGGPYG